MIVEYLNSEGHLYSTIDDDHYKYTQNAADSVSNSSNNKKNKTVDTRSTPTAHNTAAPNLPENGVRSRKKKTNGG
jgi:archaellum component FlaF (FlaF/FlaG flagellin family)